MADLADLAEQHEANARADAIARVTQARHESPCLNDDGERVCCECDALIPPARLAVLPHAVRCVQCQQMQERW